jgi:hypothetical protein
VVGGPLRESIFNMVDGLVMSQALNACQSTRIVVMEADEALISARYWRLSSSGSWCRVSSEGSIVFVYSSA